ncbi:transposase, partial [Cognatishimia sp. F0-27]|uniref:transposase n=1 Tax=Cognatishimia sp. F0-27 TaxID=2816855 RepID=UPI001D0BFCE4
MRKSRFTEAQIIGINKEREARMPTAELGRKHGLSQGTFYKFKSKYGGMEVSDAAKQKALGDENANRITQAIASDDHLTGMAIVLRSIPGVRPVASTMLIAEMPEIGTITGEAAAAITGLAPIAQDSGTLPG